MDIIGNKKLVVFEAFAGMGAQRKALDNIKANYEVGGLAEWYVPAIISYEAIHNGLKVNRKVTRDECIRFLSEQPLSMDSKKPYNPKNWSRKSLDELQIIYSAVKQSKSHGNIFDVTTLHTRKLSDIDLVTYSFPCQDLSQQGIQRGMAKGSGTRSGLLWEIEKALEATPKSKLPKYLVMENVMAIMNKSNSEVMKQWMDKLDSLGYKNDLQVLNATDFGSPQARRRAFMISSLGKKVTLPKPNDKRRRKIKDILDKTINDKDWMPKLKDYKRTPFKPKTKSGIIKQSLIDYTNFNSEGYVYSLDGQGPTLTASGANSRIKIDYEGSIRKLNARECYRYMGFKEVDFNKVDKFHKIVNQTKMTFTCGNSISVEVLEDIFGRIV